MSFEVEPDGAKDLECDGRRVRRIWGYVHDADGTVAAYFCEFTGDRDDGMVMDLLWGAWGTGTSGADRVQITLRYRITDEASGFRIEDSPGNRLQGGAMASVGLTRDQVIARNMQVRLFSVVDAIWLHDHRLEPVRRHQP